VSEHTITRSDVVYVDLERERGAAWLTVQIGASDALSQEPLDQGELLQLVRLGWVTLQ
jgi:hypothetical protein